MLKKSLLALLMVALLAPVVHADTAALTLDQVLAKHYDAMGGLDKLKKVQTMRMTGKMQMGPGMEAPFTIEKKRPAMQRMEFTFSGMTGIQAYDGAKGWSVMPFMGKKDPEPMSDDDAKEMADQADFDGALVDWKAKGHTVELVGKETVEGADTYKLKLTKKSGEIEFYYLDGETFLPIKQEGKRKVRGTEIEGESTLGDYKEVNGIMVPFSMSNGMKGSDRKQTMTFDKVEMDIPLEDAHFLMPAGALADSSKAAKPADKKDAPKKDAPKKDAAKKAAPAESKGN
jgi:hypothetical protein